MRHSPSFAGKSAAMVVFSRFQTSALPRVPLEPPSLLVSHLSSASVLHGWLIARRISTSTASSPLPRK